MSGRRYYFGADQRYNTSTSGGGKDCHDDEPLYPCDSNNNNNHNGHANNEPEPVVEPEADADADADADKDDDSEEFLQDVPYSSSSIDRSSVGSIPWADDAIKKNKQDWERVDRMLSGEEALPESLQEVELRHEIADWQRIFPSLLARKAKPLKQQSFDSGRHHPAVPDDSGDIDSMSDLSLNSLDDYDERDEDEDGFLTPTVERPHLREQASIPPNRNYLRSTRNPHLVAMLDRDLRITSVALNLRKREHHAQQPPSLQPVPTTPQSATVSRSRLRMPPILNVLDSNRRFRGLLNNRSFVQLTQVQQQPKSAALTYASSAERRHQAAGIRSAWHMPMAASRFLNNKHAIVLPALNRHRDFTATATTSSQSISSGAGTSSSLESKRHHNVQQHPHAHQHTLQYGMELGEMSTNANNTPSTGGRSISAAIHHPRSEFTSSSAFYIPYSASKFKAFK